MVQRTTTMRQYFARALVMIPALAFPGVGPAHEINDLKYGAVLFEYYQRDYFDALVEFAYSKERGGIQGHGHYPELLRGGVSLSYGLDTSAESIFTQLVQEHPEKEVRNRAWFYLAKMQYLRGDTERAAKNLGEIDGVIAGGLDDEYRYLAALVNIKLGHFDAAEQISHGFDPDSDLAPYLFFNLGVAQGKQQLTGKSLANLNRVTDYADEGNAEDRLADRALMAMSWLYSRAEDPDRARQSMARVRVEGAYSNSALLSTIWAQVNAQQFRQALAPLDALIERSIAIPEVQEAVLVKPHVYEKMGLMGRAADGFTRAGQRYDQAIRKVRGARDSLDRQDVLELFVSDLDDVLGESDWFGEAPSVSINDLSPFMLQLMADHGFQSLLKDLRDLYALRNNLRSWQQRQREFDVILQARRQAMAGNGNSHTLSKAKHRQRYAEKQLVALKKEVGNLPEADRGKLDWVVGDLSTHLGRNDDFFDQITGRKGENNAIGGHARRINALMNRLNREIRRTNALIGNLEGVMRELIRAELVLHEERLNYYRVQARLARVRILDKSLMDLEGGELSDKTPPEKDGNKESNHEAVDRGEGDHAA